MNDIPRYKASSPMQTVFITNADSCGDHIFTQLKREGNVALYSRTDCSTNKVVGYEVIIVQTVKAGTVYVKGGKPTEHDTESYPGAKSFGRLGWACVNLNQAENRFNEVLKEQKPETPVEIPTGEFNIVQFSKVNSLPVNQEAVSLLQEVLRKGTVKLSRVEEKSPGRKIQWFVRV